VKCQAAMLYFKLQTSHLTLPAKQTQFVLPDRWCAWHILRAGRILQNKANLTGRWTTIAKLRLTLPPRPPRPILRNKANSGGRSFKFEV
jgi:hypothetical protein